MGLFDKKTDEQKEAEKKAKEEKKKQKEEEKRLKEEKKAAAKEEKKKQKAAEKEQANVQDSTPATKDETNETKAQPGETTKDEKKSDMKATLAIPKNFEDAFKVLNFRLDNLKRSEDDATRKNNLKDLLNDIKELGDKIKSAIEANNKGDKNSGLSVTVKTGIFGLAGKIDRVLADAKTGPVTTADFETLEGFIEQQVCPAIEKLSKHKTLFKSHTPTLDPIKGALQQFADKLLATFKELEKEEKYLDDGNNQNDGKKD